MKVIKRGSKYVKITDTGTLLNSKISRTEFFKQPNILHLFIRITADADPKGGMTVTTISEIAKAERMCRSWVCQTLRYLKGLRYIEYDTHGDNICIKYL